MNARTIIEAESVKDFLKRHPRAHQLQRLRRSDTVNAYFLDNRLIGWAVDRTDRGRGFCFDPSTTTSAMHGARREDFGLSEDVENYLISEVNRRFGLDIRHVNQLNQMPGY